MSTAHDIDTTHDPYSLVIERLRDFGSKPGSGQDHECPTHPDENASLGVTRGRGGRVLIHCQAGCPPETVLKALGLTWADISGNYRRGRRSKSSAPAKGVPVGGGIVDLGVDIDNATEPGERRLRVVKGNPPVRTRPTPERDGEIKAPVVKTTNWAYVDENNVRLFGVKRLDHEDGSKTITQTGVRDASGKYVKPKEARSVLYRLPELLAAIDAGLPIVLVEGEKCVDALRPLEAEGGFLATTMRQGAGKDKWLDSYTETLSGAARVTVWADRDAPGLRHAAHVRGELRDAGVPTVRVVVSATTNRKDDAVDHLAAGYSLEDVVELDDAALEALIVEYGAESKPDKIWPSPNAPFEVAHEFIDRRYRSDTGVQLLVRWRGDFYEWVRTNWKPIPSDSLRAQIYDSLRHAKFYGAEDVLPWNPTSSKVTQVLDALAGACYLAADDVQPPFWIDGPNG